MILKCKQKNEYECMIYEELGSGIIPFLQDSTNLISVYIDNSQNLTITLRACRNNTFYNDTYIIGVGDYILKNINKTIMIVPREKFDEQYLLIKDGK